MPHHPATSRAFTRARVGSSHPRTHARDTARGDDCLRRRRRDDRRRRSRTRARTHARTHSTTLDDRRRRRRLRHATPTPAGADKNIPTRSRESRETSRATWVVGRRRRTHRRVRLSMCYACAAALDDCRRGRCGRGRCGRVCGDDDDDEDEDG